MAASRLEKLGTIFARANALLRKNVTPIEDKPIWHDLYVLHPPYEKPQWDREAPTTNIRSIFYEEDVIRAKFHGEMERLKPISLGKDDAATETKKFIDLYKTYRAEGALDDQQIFEVALQQIQPDAVQESELYEDDIYGDTEDLENMDEFETQTKQTPNLQEQNTIIEHERKKKKVPNLKVLFGK